MKALRQELARIRRQGYAIAQEQCFDGEISAAAPIFNISGHPIAAINVSIPMSRWTLARVEADLVPLVRWVSTEASRVQSLRPPSPWFAQPPQGRKRAVKR
jgi:DNA-binding IclR family transcriptional regulator